MLQMLDGDRLIFNSCKASNRQILRGTEKCQKFSEIQQKF